MDESNVYIVRDRILRGDSARYRFRLVLDGKTILETYDRAEVNKALREARKAIYRLP